ncbi:acyl-CoA carboxylase subunit epsilon [Streptomyces sp. NPDC020747]
MSTLGLRIEKGVATPEDLAALTVLFLTRARATAGAPRAPGTTVWRPHGFRAPHSWQG